jgi:eukaryotic-like serine/threonine-protein kinase
MTIGPLLDLAAPGAHVDDALLGTTVAGWRLVERIASSAHASVFVGERDGERAAVKLCRAAADSAASRRSVREALALGRVSHPAVAPLLASGLLPDGAPFVATRWIDGTSLAALLDDRRVRWPEMVPILAALADALIAIHGAGIVHRDLKPSNVMVPAGGPVAAVILDLGHALVFGDARITESGVAVGSVGYMSPEQAAGGTVDARSDLYALGVILYRALTGTPVFTGTASEVMRAHRHAPVEPPRQRATGAAIPRAAEDLCLWLLAKRPAERVPSAAVLAMTLRAIERSS